MQVRKTFSSLVFFFYLNFIASAQTEADAIVFGICTPQIDPCEEPFANTIVFFNNNGIDSITSRILNMPSRITGSYIDENVFYMNNGWVVINGRGEIIVEKLLSPDFEAYNTNNYRTCPTNNTGLILSVKFDNTKRIFLFYAEPSNGNIPYVDKTASYAELNPYNMDSAEAVISRDNILLKDADSTTAGNFSACRHANGRDWWVIKPGWQSNKFYRGVLNPDGITMEPFYVDLVPEEINNTFLYSNFSLDGSKYYTYASGSHRNLTLYDFDRCEGILYNPVIIEFDSIFYNENNLTIVFFSPDASKVYFNRPGFYNPISEISVPGGLYQYDIATNSMNFVFEYSQARGLMVSPNGKWILYDGYEEDTTTSLGFRLYLSVMYEPNKPVLECNLQENQFEIDNVFNFETPQNWANYRLGPIDGSVCDSLGLDAPIDTGLEILFKEQVKVFPNPTNSVFNIALQNKAPRSLRVFDMLGKEVYIAFTNAKEAQINLKDLNLSNGIYLLEINNYATKQRTIFKVLYEEQ